MTTLAQNIDPRPSSTAELTPPDVLAEETPIRVVAELPFARVIRRGRKWVMQTTYHRVACDADWTDDYTREPSVFPGKPKVVVSPAEVRSCALTSMRYASEFLSVYVPLLERIGDVVPADKSAAPGTIGAFLLDAKTQLEAHERAVTANWSRRKAYLPYGYVRAAQHWGVLVGVVCTREAKLGRYGAAS